MRLLVTRPEPDGERTATLLRAKGCDVLIAPLLRMLAVDADIGDDPCDALAFTSANAVRAVAGHARLQWLVRHPAYAVGRRTAAAARAAGFDRVMSAEGDVAALAGLIKANHGPGARLLHLAGEDRSGDLAADLAVTGIAVRTVAVYRMDAVTEFPASARDRLMAGSIDGVLHFSQRSAVIYIDRASTAGIRDRALAPEHFCLSRQVAAPLRAAGAGRVRVASRPSEADLIALVPG